MTGDRRRELLTGASAGTTVAGAAALAHVAAGGHLPILGSVLAVAAVMTAATALGPKIRWTFGRVLTASCGVQVVLHVAFAGTGGHGVHAGHTHADHAAASTGSGSGMWIAHTAVALAAAAAVRWGWRWMRSMPALLRAVVLTRRSVGAPFALPSSGVSSFVVGGRGRTAMSLWRSRGPPAMA